MLNEVAAPSSPQQARVPHGGYDPIAALGPSSEIPRGINMSPVNVGV